MKILTIVFLSMLSVTAMAQDRVSQYDQNHNGVVDYSELTHFCDVTKSLFDRADKNSDGVLSNVELQKAHRYLLESCKKH
jgi:Ca2+-binding EF-hand superfamily protein